MAAAVLCIALAARAGEPECAQDSLSCPKSVAGGDWYQGARGAVRGDPSNANTVGQARALCNIDAWREAEQCLAHCPNYLEIDAGIPTMDAPVRLCVEPDYFVPFNATRSMSLLHPVNGRRLRVVTPPSASRLACRPDDLAEGDYKDAIVLVERGACYFSTKAINVQRAGGIAGVMVNSALDDRDPARQLAAVMGGPAAGVEIPFAMIARFDGMPLLDLIAAGAQLTGVRGFTCTPPPKLNSSVPDWHGYCPSADGGIAGRCNLEQDDRRRLCVRCPHTLALQDASQEYPVPPTFCLYGNRLLPRAERTLLSSRYATPHLFAKGDVVVAAPGALASGGCRAADYASFAAGKVVAIDRPRNCVSLTAVRAAAAANATAVVMMSDHDSSDVFQVTGNSAFVTIPVHALPPRDAAALVEYAARLGTAVAAGIYALPAVMLADGIMPPTIPVPPLPPPPYEVPREAIDIVGPPLLVIMLMTALLLLLTAAVGGLLVKIFRKVKLLLRGRGAAPEASASGQAAKSAAAVAVGKRGEASGVPLGVATVALSLALVIVVTAVALTLATAAGHRATSVAMDSARTAAEVSKAVAVDNVDDLARQLRQAKTATIIGILDKLVNEGNSMTGAIAMVYNDLDDHRWDTFDRLFPRFMDAVALFTLTEWTDFYTKWGVRVDTYAHYVATGAVKTDARPDAEREDGVNGSVAETNDGALYGVAEFDYSRRTKTSRFRAALPRWLVRNALENAAGQDYGPPDRFVADKEEGSLVWRVPEYRNPDFLPDVGHQLLESVGHALTVFTPLFNRMFERVGSAQVQLPFSSLRFEMIVSLGVATNISMAILDRREMALADAKVLISNHAGTEVVASNPYSTIGAMQMHDRLYGLRNVPVAELNVLGEVLASTPVHAMADAEVFSTVQNIRGVLPTRTGTIFALATAHEEGDAGSARRTRGHAHVKDFSGNNWRTGYASDTAVGVHVDPRTGRQSMWFDGNAVLRIYRHLSTDVPYVVEQYEPAADGSWGSRDPFFNGGLVGVELEGSENVSCVRRVVPAGAHGETIGGCLLRATPFGLNSRAETQRKTMTFLVKPDEDFIPSASDPVARLWSSDPTGESTLAVYADGTLMLRIFRRYCTVHGVPGGLPRGVWTTLSASWRHGDEDGLCRVHINGTFHGVSQRLSAPTLVDRGNFYHVVGQNFHGAIDAVVAHDYFVTDTEAMDIHVMLMQPYDAAVVRNASAPGLGGVEAGMAVPSEDEEWYMDLQMYNRDGGKVSGIDWMVAMLIRRSDVMSAVEKNNAVLLSNLEDRRANTAATLDNEISATVLIATAMGLFFAIVFMAIHERITAPFAQIAAVTLDAAEMRVDEINPLPSVISEVVAIQCALGVMTRNLKEYRSYMPQSVFAGRLDTSDESGRGSDKTAATLRRNHSSPSLTHLDDTPSSRVALGSSGHSQSLCFTLQLALTRKRFSLCMVNTRGFHARINAMEGPAQALAFTQSLLVAVTNGVRKTNGVLESFMGDRFCASFGGSRMDTSNAMSCTVAGVAIREELRAMGVSISGAIAYGVGLLGNAGTADMRTYSFLSPVVPYAAALVDYARCMNVPLVISRDAQTRIGITHATRVVGLVKYSPFIPEEIVAQVLDPMKDAVDDDEWMYELERARAASPSAAWDTWALAVVARRWEDARAAQPAAAVYDSASLVYHVLDHAVATQRYQSVDLATPHAAAIPAGLKPTTHDVGSNCSEPSDVPSSTTIDEVPERRREASVEDMPQTWMEDLSATTQVSNPLNVR